MEFLKIYSDMEQFFCEFSQEEKGNLLDAMMAYAFRGEDTEFDGRERFLWPALRRHIDQCAAYIETRRENGAKGGRPKKNNQEETLVSEKNQPITTGYDEETIKEKKRKEKENISKGKEKENTVTRTRFIAPTVEEVNAYCQERRNGVNPQRFVDYYQANGWRVGKNPMKDWRACVRTWEKNGYDGGARDSPGDTGVGYGQILRQREYDADYFASLETKL